MSKVSRIKEEIFAYQTVCRILGDAKENTQAGRRYLLTLSIWKVTLKD